jgi:hypothetical protein
VLFPRWRLERALRRYPLYDPPNKAEERLLSKELAVENFDYFMRVRHQRMAALLDLLWQFSGVAVTSDQAGVVALNRWFTEHADFLLISESNGDPRRPYLTYDPPWTGKHAGLNLLFDIGITWGEIVIANCPKLRWDMDPISAVLPRTGKWLKETPNTCFQRPELTGFDDPITRKRPLVYAYTTARAMKGNLYPALAPAEQRFISEHLPSAFDRTIQQYPAGDPCYEHAESGLLAPEDYLELTNKAGLDDADEVVAQGINGEL